MRIAFSKYCWLILLSAAFVLAAQLARIERPYRGHFASYQGTVMASIARNMLDENFRDIFRPKTNALILTSEKTYHLNQYPTPALLVAAAIKLFGGSFEFWGRFQAILFNLLSVCFFWGIVRKIADEATAAIGSILFLVSPYSVIYGQAFFCESLALCSFLAALLLVLNTTAEEHRGWLKLAFSALLFSVALVNRVHFILFLPPMVYGVWRSSRSFKAVFCFLALSLAVPAAWYGFTYWVSVREMVRTQTSFFFQASSSDLLWGTSICSLEYWKRIFDVFALNILTPLVFPFLGIGLAFAFQDIRKFGWMLMMFGFGLLTVFLFPQKIMEHDFYLQGLFPFVVLLAAMGIRGIALHVELFRKKSVILLALLCFFGMSARYFLHPLFGFSPKERNVAEAGKWIQAKTQPADIVVLAGENTPVLNFYANRRVFGFSLTGPRELPGYFTKRNFSPAERVEIAAFERSMENDVSLLEFFRKKGATYFFISDRSEAEEKPELLQYLRSHYSEISPTETSFCLFRL